ncbi:hypothetical protein HA41_17590 [Pantoea conspicua]|uniref:Uncharacterized protein n=1 Tax=Pantoea conspicua TaxID=472705 RepID=A0A1X1BRW5_9GAMM|nr:hypothetical protein HA41_17590 [Pantoea conspicua]
MLPASLTIYFYQPQHKLFNELAGVALIIRKTDKKLRFYIIVLIDRINLIFIVATVFNHRSEMYCGPLINPGFKFSEVHHFYGFVE